MLADGKRRIANHEDVKANFFDDALETAQAAELSSRNRTVVEMQDLKTHLSRIEGLQKVIDEVAVSRSIDDLLEGIYRARGLPHDW